MKKMITVENLGKKYTIDHLRGEGYVTLRDVFTNNFTRLLKRVANPANKNLSRSTREEFWALKGVSFEVKQGEKVGIIGRNGAGKSTLLKLLSRITRPTTGRISIRGRVGSLLEVGTGFHPELTGRENIFLNGAILGMSKSDIVNKFDEIVAFAEMEKFLDTPVKRYSSGMFVRLGFAVAAHLEPESLLVDEVLSVGDISFQKKCLGKMGDVATSGRTILFVSHQMNSIRKLCDRCIWVDKGSVRMIGKTTDVVGAYESAHASGCGENNAESGKSALTVPARFLRWEIHQPRSDQSHILSTPGPVTFKFVIEVNRKVALANNGVALYDSDQRLMWATDISELNLDVGVHELFYKLNSMPLRPGAYSWLVSLYENRKMVDLWNGLPNLIIGTELLTNTRDEWTGILNIPCEFSTHLCSQAGVVPKLKALRK